MRHEGGNVEVLDIFVVVSEHLSTGLTRVQNLA